MHAIAAIDINIEDDGIGCDSLCPYLDISHRHGYRCFLWGIDSARQIPRILSARQTPPGPIRCRECIIATGNITNEKRPHTQ